MKASWIETQQIEQYLQGADSNIDVQAMHAQILCDTMLYDKVQWQKASYSYIHAYAQDAIRSEIAQAQKAVFERPAYAKFRQLVQSIFS